MKIYTLININAEKIDPGKILEMPDKCPRPLLKERKKLLSAIEECLREGGERDRGLDGWRVRLLWVTVTGLMSGLMLYLCPQICSSWMAPAELQLCRSD